MSYKLSTWNQHNIYSYVIWGGWQKLEEFCLEIPGNEMCKERKEEIVEYATMEKEIKIRKTKKIWQGYLHEIYEDSDGVWKRKRPLTIYIYGRCVNMYARCWCKLEDVMLKGHHKYLDGLIQGYRGKICGYIPPSMPM